MTMTNANDEDIAIIVDSINHQMCLHGMDANRWRDLDTLGCSQRAVSGKLKASFQSLMIPIGLIQPEMFHAAAKDIDNIFFGLDAEAVTHTAKIGRAHV